MAIGSDPEIGTQFGSWSNMTDTERQLWWYHMVTHWGADLAGGYGKVVYVDPKKREEYGNAILLSLPEM
jgi:hypothetical protein